MSSLIWAIPLAILGGIIYGELWRFVRPIVHRYFVRRGWLPDEEARG